MEFVRKKLVFIILIAIILVLLFLLLYFYNKSNSSYLNSITILGNKIDIIPGKYVYSQISFKNAEVKNEDTNGCNLLFNYDINNKYKKLHYAVTSVYRIVNGEQYGYIIIKFTDQDELNKDVEKVKKEYAYYFDFNIQSGIKVDDACDSNGENSLNLNQ